MGQKPCIPICKLLKMLSDFHVLKLTCTLDKTIQHVLQTLFTFTIQCKSAGYLRRVKKVYHGWKNLKYLHLISDDFYCSVIDVFLFLEHRIFSIQSF